MQLGLKQRGLKFLGATAFLALASFAAGEAQATDGYFQYGYGARQGALGGAGVADSRDAMSLSLNPAGLVDVGRQWQFGASIFMPYRSYTATGTAFAAPGKFDSNENIFAIPNIAYNNPIDADSSWGFAVFGNGGMNTNWPGMANATQFCAGFFGGVPGTFCAGSLGVDFMPFKESKYMAFSLMLASPPTPRICPTRVMTIPTASVCAPAWNGACRPTSGSVFRASRRSG
jgi:hypothetical protein